MKITDIMFITVTATSFGWFWSVSGFLSLIWSRNIHNTFFKFLSYILIILDGLIISGIFPLNFNKLDADDDSWRSETIDGQDLEILCSISAQTSCSTVVTVTWNIIRFTIFLFQTEVDNGHFSVKRNELISKALAKNAACKNIK